MTARVANGIYRGCIGLAVLFLLLGLMSFLFGSVGLGSALLFYLMITASIYLIGSWVFWTGRRA
jgi:hypothetical protein